MTEAMYAVQMGATADGSFTDIEETKRITHDNAIASAGSHRTGGVRWSIYAGRERFVVLTAAVAEAGTGPDAAVFRDLFAWCEAHPAGRLIVAMCPVQS